MRPDLMEILCCPVCKGELTLNAQRKDGTEIVDGTLTCAKCAVTYPIQDGIPNLLPPDERD
ncbi:MAG: methytransferase partner Trm112 [Thermoplasmata archaeon]